MKYEVIHSVLMGAAKSFKRGEELTPEQLTEAGFDVEFLVRNGAVEPMRGTFEPGDVPAADLSVGGKPGDVRTVTGPRFTAAGTPAGKAEAPADGAAAAADVGPNAPGAGKPRSGKS